MSNKTLTVIDGTTAAFNIDDLTTWGDADTWKLICKASSDEEGWMKSTKAMAVEGVGVVIQVTTQQDDHVAEALTFVPFATIIDVRNEHGALIGRRLGTQSGAGVVLE